MVYDFFYYTSKKYIDENTEKKINITSLFNKIKNSDMNHSFPLPLDKTKKNCSVYKKINNDITEDEARNLLRKNKELTPKDIKNIKSLTKKNYVIY